MKYNLWYSVVVRDRDGKVLSRERRRAKSLLLAWNTVMFTVMTHASVPNFTKDTGGTFRTPSFAFTTSFTIATTSSQTDYGVRVGTGDTAVAIDDYALEAPIAHGSGAGQMSHAACTVNTYTVAAPSCSFVVSRTITNISGGSITVKEAGLYFKNSSNYFCGARDVFVSPQVVPNGGSITIDWTLKVTV